MPVLALVDTRREYGHVFDIYVPIAIGVFVLYVGLIVALAVLGRRRPPEQASRRHEHNPLELTYAITLVAVVAFLLLVTYTAEHKIDSVSLTEKPRLTVDVIASKWEWTFSYPAYGITHRSGTVDRQPLVVPTNEAVRFKLLTRDVIHGFWIPQLDFKRDAFPGTTEVVVLDFDRAGDFLGHCSQFCGLRHADMWFPVIAVSPSRFRAWADSRGRAAV